MRKLSAGIITLALLVSLTSCAKNDASPDTSPTSDASAPAIEPSASPNEIQKDAADNYRAALELSKTSAATSGLTELWYDSDKALSQVAVQDPTSGKYAMHDITADTAMFIDEAAMMPTRLLSELDGLIKGGADVGSVKSSTAAVFEVTNTIDLVVYQTTYQLDNMGRISTADIIADDEALGQITFVYSVTKEGKAALKLAADQAS